MSSSKLAVGIVGLPNAGKSTLFNALASRRLAETAPRPFTTIEPHDAVVAVPDKNLDELWDLVRKDPSATLRMTESEKISASVTFIDIAGLVKGAHEGEGLGNQFLAKIREVDAIVHVVRAFSNPQVSHSPASPETASRGRHPSHEPGSVKQIIEDIEIVNLELELGGIEKKPTVYVVNMDEQQLSMNRFIDSVYSKVDGEVIAVCAKLEEELIDLSDDEKREYLEASGIRRQALDKLIQKAYKMLDLITFYTIKGGKEIHAWSIKRGSNALEAAAEVHTDFAKNFIKAEVIGVSKLLQAGSWKNARERGKVRLEGKDYVVKDGDVVEFKVGGG